MSTESTLACTLIRMNNRALAMFVQGRFSESVEVFSNAYDLLESYRKQSIGITGPGSHMLQPNELYPEELSPLTNFKGVSDTEALSGCVLQESSNCNSNGIPNPVDGFHTATGLCEGMDYRLDHNRCISSLASWDSTVHSLYNRGLMLTVDPFNEDSRSLLIKHQHRTSSILLYNIALCYHNLGTHLGVSCALPRALQIYDMALASIQRGVKVVEVQKLLMAILNNCANIYACFCRTEEMHRCYENLKTVLAVSTVEMVMNDEDYSFFFLNALFQGKELGFAPAA